MNIEDKDKFRSVGVTEVATTASSMSDFTGSEYTSKEYTLNLMNQLSKKSTVPINAYKEIVRFLIAQFDNTPYLNHDLETVNVTCRYGNPERIIAKINEH